MNLYDKSYNKAFKKNGYLKKKWPATWVGS